jgi:hypothetical protein
MYVSCTKLFTCSFPAFVLAVVLSGCASLSVPSAEFFSFVVLGEDGAAVARVITADVTCPFITLDGHSEAMTARALAQTVPLRPTQSTPQDSKPSAFPVLACEAQIPVGTVQASVSGRSLPIPSRATTRIVVIGDTGCRLKKDGNFQDCNNTDAYPFSQIASAAAAWKPQLVVHVGDYHYRENACPVSNPGCSGSPWGYGWDAWSADFFTPGQALLQAAPWVIVRGNHESCSRAGQGFWRFLDPRPMQAARDCNDAANDSYGDYSDPYAVPLGANAQLIVLDTSNTTHKGLATNDIRMTKFVDTYRKFDALSKNATYNIGLTHHPILAFATGTNKAGVAMLYPGDAGLQNAFGALNPNFLPAGVSVMLSGHVHLWEQLSFSSDHPTQFVAGFSGTEEETVPLPVALPSGMTPARGAIVEKMSSWVDGFGFMTMERTGPQEWDIQVRNKRGEIVKLCRLHGKKSACTAAQVK